MQTLADRPERNYEKGIQDTLLISRYREGDTMEKALNLPPLVLIVDDDYLLGCFAPALLKNSASK